MPTKLSSFDQTMKLFASHDGRLAILERKVGLFAFAGLGALLLLFAVVAIEQGMFASTTKLRFQTNDAGMIHEGMEVRLNGFKVGKLLGISLKDDGAVEVQFFVNNKYLLNIRHGAKVRLADQGLFGDSVLEIVPGPKDQPGLVANELLPFERQLGMGELAHDLVERLKPILDNVRVATSSLNESDGLINHVKQVAVKFEKTGKDISSLADQSQGAVAEFNQKMGKTLDSFRDVALDAGKIAASSVESIPPMLRDGREAAEDARNIISSTKDSWPVKNMMAPGETKILPMDSYGVINAQPK
jgi:ABC-type transporter Mla subunit MlaD